MRNSTPPRYPSPNAKETIEIYTITMYKCLII